MLASVLNNSFIRSRLTVFSMLFSILNSFFMLLPALSLAATINMPKQPLDQAITQLAQRTGLKIGGDSKLLQGKNAPAIDGDYSAEQALKMLLQDSGIGFKYTNQNTVVLYKNSSANDDGVITLDPVRIRGAVDKQLVKSAYTSNRLSTATGLNISSYETPQSVTVISQERIQDQKLETLTDIVNNTIGVSAKAHDSSRDAYYARGFLIDNYQIDGVSIQWDSGWNAGETQTSMAVYERAEVVRGATGLLTGAGNPSASINLIRKHADSDEFAGSVSVMGGSWNTYGTTIDLMSPLNDSGTVRGRVVGHYQNGDSFIDLAGDETSVLYAVLDADVSNKTFVSIGFSYQENVPTATLWGGLPVWFDDGSRTNWRRSKTKGANWTSWSSTNKSLFVDVEHTFANNWLLKLKASRVENVSEERLVWLWGVLNKDTGIGLNASPRLYDSIREQNDFSLELTKDFRWFQREHELIFGLTSSRQSHHAFGYDRDSVAPVDNFFLWDGSYPQPNWSNRHSYKNAITKQTGFYAATRLSIIDPLKVILGGRYTDWSRNGGGVWTGKVDFGDKVFLPYAGVLYELNPDSTVYLSYTEIFQAQNERNRTGKYLDPLTGKNYEIGLKNLFSDGKVTSTVSLFRTEQDNLAQKDIGVFVPNTDPPSQAYKAVQGAVSRGLELELLGELTPDWNMTVGYTFFKAKDNEGEPVNTNHPHKLFKLFTSYRLPGDWNKLSLGGGVNWEGKNYTDTENPVTNQPERLEQPAYALVNLMAKYTIQKDLIAQLNIDNVFDKTYYSQIGFFNQLAYGKPRNFKLALKYNF